MNAYKLGVYSPQKVELKWAIIMYTHEKLPSTNLTKSGAQIKFAKIQENKHAPGKRVHHRKKEHTSSKRVLNACSSTSNLLEDKSVLRLG